MKDPNSKALDLFLLMFNLSQLTLKRKIVDIFVKALEEIWPNTSVSYQSSKSGEENNVIEISASSSNYGYVKIDVLPGLKNDELDLLHNAVAMLGIILKKNEQDKLLADEKLHLQKLVNESIGAIKESEERFRKFFEYSIVGKSITTIDGKMKTNKAFSDILGYSKTDLSKVKWQEITHGDDIERDQEIISSMISGEKASARWEKRYMHKNGNIVWVDISTSLQRDNNGKPVYFITSINDITERKWAEDEILRLNEGLEQKVNERTAELKESISQLEELNRVFVDRELKMIELKERIAELEKERK